ncbi:MAG: phosphatidate cytidylyltransferase [Coriobacteriia bacterium]|nr:phosphatidate cytidylyltransferase [Coriobacteriia bacterium]
MEDLKTPFGDVQVREPEGIKPVRLAKRIITAGLYAAVVLAAVWFGRYSTGIVFGIMAAVAASEFYAMERRESRLPNEMFGVVAAGLMPPAAALWGMSGLIAVATALIAASLAWHVLFMRVRTADTAVTVFGALYTGFLLSYLVLIISQYAAGTLLAFTVVLSVWANDSLAYLLGSLIGRHKMAPRISPKKSWEGFVAGVLGTLVVWLAVPTIYPLIFPNHPEAGLTVPWAIVTALAVGIAVIIGDLAESRMKREAGVKDSGNILPGHGGFLDRLDSLILVCLVAYWMLWWAGVTLA